VAEIGWVQNYLIIEKCKNEQERLFYVSQTKEKGWSKNDLLEKIQSHYYENKLLAQNNFEIAVEEELKAREFSPKDIGQLQMYLMAANEVVKKSEHNPSIGILVCRDKDRIVVEYLLNAQNQPIGVATYNKYNHLKELPNEIAKYLPSEEDILKRLEFYSKNEDKKN